MTGSLHNVLLQAAVLWTVTQRAAAVCAVAWFIILL